MYIKYMYIKYAYKPLCPDKSLIFLAITKTYPCYIQRIVSAIKMKIPLKKKKTTTTTKKQQDIYNILAQTIECGKTLEPPRRWFS